MSDRLPGPDRRFRAILLDAQRAGRLPSTVAGLVDDRGLVWSDGVGEVGGDPAGDPADTQYRIGSITKTFTAVLVLQARDEGLVDLAHPLAAYLPEAAYGDRSLRSLLSHSAGLPGEPAGPWWERRQGGDLKALITANADRRARFAEGSDHLYSNLAYGLLGAMVARIRGEDWSTLVRTRITEPLGMSRTTYQATSPHAQGYSVGHLLGTLTEEPASDTGAMAPAGQLWSTVTDLAAYAGFVLRGNPDVLSLDTLVGAGHEVHPGSQYGLGFRTTPGGSGRLVGQTGTMPGFMAGFFCDRDRGTAAAVLSNATLGQQSVSVCSALLTALDEARATLPAAWRPSRDVPDEVPALVGTWYWGETAFEIRWQAGELAMVEVRAGTAYEEFRRGPTGEWCGTDGSVLEVARTSDGAVSHLLCDTYLFTRTPYDPASPVPGPRPPR